MAVIVTSIGLKGIEGYKVSVEVEVLDGVESMTIVGLPGAAVKESRERVLAALKGFQCDFADQKVIVYLSPAEERKIGPLFDVAIALAMLQSNGQLKKSIPKDTAFLGSLSLDGSIHAVRGMLSAVISAKKLGINRLFLPYDSALPIQTLDGVELVYVEHLHDVINHLSDRPTLPLLPREIQACSQSTTFSGKDFRYIIGHQQAKRALEIAASGGHNVLMSGPPGCGKSLLAESFSSILPQLPLDSQLENMSLYQLADSQLVSYSLPPFRSPHHSASAVSIIGGGSNPRPGEVSLAHNGVLFLDEMAEFPKRTLDMLRQPLETGQVIISRANGTVTYPARFILIGAMNPCPCGYFGSNTRYCTCTPKAIQAYQNRISGPIEDRIDLLLNLQSVQLNPEQQKQNESSEDIRKRVEQARERQYERYGKSQLNGNVSIEVLFSHVRLTDSQQGMLQNRAVKANWSNRVQMKMIRTARTISDIRGEDEISDEAIWEAMTLRRSYVNQIQKQKGSWMHGS